MNGVERNLIGKIAKSLKRLRELESKYKTLRTGPLVFAGTFRKPDQAFLLKRGDPFQKAGIVSPNIPKVLGDLKIDENENESTRRLKLAQAIADPKNPLTARVIVNRIWQKHFGIGIVDTPSDFGFNGSYPTHPKLLDWLAQFLMKNKWSLKAIHKKILSSQTFQQQGFTNQLALAKDSKSRYLWRFPPRRLEAEALRDSILLVSGNLNKKMYGPGFDFFEPAPNPFVKRVPLERFSAEGNRRMIYGKKIRLEYVGIFGSLDCPDASQMSPKRSRSTTPVQALGLFNSEFVNNQAKILGQDIKAEYKNHRDQINAAVLRTLGRPATKDELKILERVAKSNGIGSVCRILLNTNEFTFIN